MDKRSRGQTLLCRELSKHCTPLTPLNPSDIFAFLSPPTILSTLSIFHPLSSSPMLSSFSSPLFMPSASVIIPLFHLCHFSFLFLPLLHCFRCCCSACLSQLLTFALAYIICFVPLSLSLFHGLKMMTRFNPGADGLTVTTPW